jgi:hypothetical protein
MILILYQDGLQAIADKAAADLQDSTLEKMDL